MADIFSKEKRSWIMSRIRSKNTGLERVVFRALGLYGIRFTKHYRRARGTPDIAVPSKKIAVFIDGDFWHGYRYPLWRGKLKNKFWRDKIERNRARDRRTFAALRRRGWRVRRVWEHDIKRHPFETIKEIAAFVKGRP